MTATPGTRVCVASTRWEPIIAPVLALESVGASTVESDLAAFCLVSNDANDDKLAFTCGD